MMVGSRCKRTRLPPAVALPRVSREYLVLRSSAPGHNGHQSVRRFAWPRHIPTATTSLQRCNSVLHVSHLQSIKVCHKVCAVQGICRNGDACRFLHVKEEEPSATGVECGICYEPLIADGSARFGLLDQCTHAFCLDCIRGWREKGMQVSDAGTVRRCPVCRVPSFLVIPSTTLPRDAESKAVILKAYKASLASIPCRHFEFGKRDCPVRHVVPVFNLLPRSKRIIPLLTAAAPSHLFILRKILATPFRERFPSCG